MFLSLMTGLAVALLLTAVIMWVFTISVSKFYVLGVIGGQKIKFIAAKTVRVFLFLLLFAFLEIVAFWTILGIITLVLGLVR